MKRPIEPGDIVFHYRLPPVYFWGLIALLFGLGGLGLYGSLASEPPKNFMAFISGFNLLIGIIFSPLLYHSKFISKGTLILGKDCLYVPNFFHKGFKEISYSEIQSVFFRYRARVNQAEGAVLYLASGKQYALALAAFIDETAFVECVVLISSFLNDPENEY